ncbi:methyltransferase domain-containing protein [Mycetocola tolaasinivorans]|uniref:Methyltransferase domain-containing protein n=1 Tax=Mycetocola tolaasinivorans TaxID=76635 RepID=A0A3L7A5Y3_9MICO|nr:methyltransferase [Mycetocola tolaasinivorans]RLP75240.1 methyltransferase domain-containing protein [Mycetocola tolaasinivorans]
MTLEQNPATLAALRADLIRADFHTASLLALWGEDADAALVRANTLPAERALAARRDATSEPAFARAVLAKLFILGHTLSRDEVAAALPSAGIDGLIDLALAENTDAGLRALLELRPYTFTDGTDAVNWWLAADLGETIVGGPLRPDHVVGVGGASRTLAGLIVPESIDTALDLGTGCGIQALHLARYARRVIATDISERALRVARFNADLNEVAGIEFRLGSMFEPVAGERFDRIVSNPPFVITPRGADAPEYEYRDGGREGDDIVREMVQEAPRHLTPGGLVQMLGNWEYRADVDAFERIRSWLDADVDAWVLERERQDPVRYAETWIRDGGTRPGDPEFVRLCGAWLDDFERRGTVGVGFGYVLLRRTDSDLPIWRRFERVGSRVAGALGAHVGQVLAARDWQAARSDAALLGESLRVSGDVTEERHYWPGNEDPSVMILHQGAGFGRTVDLDTGLAAIVGASDGTLEVGVLIAAIAELLEVDTGALGAELLPRLRELLDEGFLVPEEFAAA